MMVFQYAVWGLWLPLLGRYLMAKPEEGGLGFTGTDVAWIIALAGSVGAITAPFIAGQLADRYFRTERYLAVSMFLGGGIIWVMASQTTFTAWLLLSMAYSVIYTPTLALTNSLAFSHLPDREKQFPLVRIWGTIGWILAGWVFAMIWLQSGLKFTGWMPPFFGGTELADSTSRLADSLRASGILAGIYGVFCLFLPATPPRRNTTEPLAFRKAFALLTHRSFAVLVGASLLIAVIHNLYFLLTADFFVTRLGLLPSQIGPAMTLGQFAEIGIMAVLGFALKSLGFRKVITIGALAYLARYGIFGSSDHLPVWVVITSQVLHGVCYGCFFATAYIYVDRIAPPDVRNSAQTVFGIIILGLGPMLSVPVMMGLEKAFRHNGVLDYSGVWYTLAAVGLVAALGFWSLFRDETASLSAPTQEPVAEAAVA